MLGVMYLLSTASIQASYDPGTPQAIELTGTNSEGYWEHTFVCQGDGTGHFAPLPLEQFDRYKVRGLNSVAGICWATAAPSPTRRTRGCGKWRKPATAARQHLHCSPCPTAHTSSAYRPSTDGGKVRPSPPASSRCRMAQPQPSAASAVRKQTHIIYII